MVFVGIFAQLIGKAVPESDEVKLIPSAGDFPRLHRRNPSAGPCQRTQYLHFHLINLVFQL